ncbi:MAG: hypothetical protein WC473_01955 [Patescibacteria group bacterium]
MITQLNPFPFPFQGLLSAKRLKKRQTTTIPTRIPGLPWDFFNVSLVIPTKRARRTRGGIACSSLSFRLSEQGERVEESLVLNN